MGSHSPKIWKCTICGATNKHYELNCMHCAAFKRGTPKFI